MKRGRGLLLAGTAVASLAVASPAIGAGGARGDATTSSATRAIQANGNGNGNGNGGGNGAGGGSTAPDPNPRARVACEHRGNGVPRFCTAPQVNTGAPDGVTSAQASSLAAALEVDGAFVDNGVFKFIGETFQALPSVQADLPVSPPSLGGDAEDEQPTGVDVLNLAALIDGSPLLGEVMSDDAAIAQVREAIGDLVPAGARASATNSTAEVFHNDLVDVPGLPVVPDRKILLDTQVAFDVALPDGTPVRGPGSSISVTLDPEGTVTQAHYATLGALTDGPRVQIVDPALGPDVCDAALGAAAASAALVYYAPAPVGGRNVPAALPHFECVPADAPNGDTPLARFVPAVVDVPVPTIASYDVQGSTVTATATATGGDGPYTFTWSSAGTTGEQPAAGATATYTFVPRDGIELPAQETLVLTVTDANGITASTSQSFAVAGGTASVVASDAGDFQAASHAIDTTIEVGGEGGTYSPDCSPYVNSWRDVHNAAGNAKSAFTYYANYAWSSDFQDPTKKSGGDDHSYADDVDALFYCGHGSKGSFTFENTSGPTDKNVTPNEAMLGERDLEWFVLLSCQVMREDFTGSSWSATWAEAFNGLHAMLGFHTNAYAAGNLGRDVAKYMTGYNVAAKNVHDSFVQAVKDGQPAGTTWATLYPVSTASEWNRNDWFWGEGSVGADIPASNIYYWVRYTGTV